jgi:hypothetical protein
LTVDARERTGIKAQGLTRRRAKVNAIASLSALKHAVAAGGSRSDAGRLGGRHRDDMGLHAVGNAHGGIAAGVGYGGSTTKGQSDVRVAARELVAVRHDGTLASVVVRRHRSTARQALLRGIAAGRGRAPAVVNRLRNALNAAVVVGVRGLESKKGLG